MVEQVYYPNSHQVPYYEYIDDGDHDYYEEEYHHSEGPYIPPQPRGLPVFKIKSEIIPELGGVSQNFGGDVKAWLPDGYSQIFRSHVFGPSGFWTRLSFEHEGEACSFTTV